MKFEILNRYTGAVQITAEITCSADASLSIKLGLAVCWAVKSGANLSEANLGGANLSGANLSRAYLSGANLSRANLGGANLSGANLSRAYLGGANLGEANLSEAYLSRANLGGANLSGANLSGAYLGGANLSRANLSGANLSEAYLSEAYLSRANLGGANLSRANLSGANLSRAENAELAIAMTRILPEGNLIVWKKLFGGEIAKLSVPADAKRSHAFGRKCRAEFVDVIEGEGVSNHDRTTKYAPGLRVVADAFDPEWTEECAGGIPFFITRAEAEAYSF